MADPQKYQRDYSFTDFQANNPSSPLPGSRVDNELENVELSLGETIDALKDIRRSDGKLKNQIVTVDSLDPTVAAGVGTGALASAAAAAASADAASDSAVAAAASATAADGSATAASGYASNALTSRNEAEAEKILAQTARTGAQTARDYAAQWSSAPEGVDVDDGVNPVSKSSYHWAQVALGAVTGALPDGSVTTSKIVDDAVTRAKLAAAVRTELDDKADVSSLDGKQPLDQLLTNIAALATASGQFLQFVGPDSVVARPIVGSVAQVAGVPMASIVETGSNGNGTYTKFADGTMICTGSLSSPLVTSLSVGAVFTNPTAVAFTFPAAFVGNPPHVSPFASRNVDVASGLTWATTSSAFETTTSATQIFLVGHAATCTGRVSYVAQGRWF